MEAAAEQVGKDLAALKQELQGEIDGDVAAEATLRENADKALDERVKPLEAHVAAQPGVDAAQDARIKALEDDAPVKQAAIEAAQAAANQAQSEVDVVEGRALALEGRMETAEEDIARLDGAVEVEGSVKKQIKDAVDAINTDAEALEARVKANEDDIAEINGVIGVPAVEADENGEGAQAATGLHKLIADEDARILGEAKAHAEQKIADLVDSAPDAMNTLNELAGAINANKGVYDAYVEQHAQAMADMKKDLQDEIDDDVAAEAALREQADNALGGRIDTLDAAYKAADTTLDGKITKEAQDRAAAVKEVADELAKQKDAEQEGTLANKIAANAQAIADEASRADAKEKAIEEALANAIEKEVDDRDAAIKVETDRAVDKENKIAQAVSTEKGRAEGQEAAIRGEMAAEATRVNEKIANDIAAEAALRVQEDGKLQTAINGLNERMEAAEGDIDALEAFQGQQETKNTELDAEDERIAGLVASEVTNRENAVKAVADDLANNYSNTVEVKAIIAAVVNSLAIELTNDDKLLLKLGGTDDAIVLKEVSLNIANDADIQAIIDGLDDAE